MTMSVLAAMSGGVDSFAACLLLRREGFLVFGGHMILHDGGEKEAYDAYDSASHIGLPFYIFHVQKEFHRQVVEPFCQGYAQGLTPNPCLLCNQAMKFGLFLRRAKEMNFTAMATGHYARLEYDQGARRYLLKKAVDEQKDQSYVLSVLTQEQLSSALFPLGEYTKAQARQMVAEAKIPLAEKKDSQDICFVPDGDYVSFLRRQGVKPRKGQFIGPDGTPLGPHQGAERYTLGQRRGLGVNLGKRAYVVGKQGGDVQLGPEEQLYASQVRVGPLNWVSMAPTDRPFTAQAMLRYSAQAQSCRVEPLEDGCLLLFDQPQRAPTPGQTAVIYDGPYVLASGVIQSAKGSR